MSGARTLQAARAAGVQLWVNGDDLVLEAAIEPPAMLLRILARDKAELVQLLRPANDVWSSAEWQALFDERAAIVEFDGGLSRPEAEAHALAHCAAEWIEYQPICSQWELADAIAALTEMGIGPRATEIPNDR
jgi:hypothetical protein